MFTSFSAWALDFLSKAAGHKYIRRIPYASGGKTRYRYIYKVTHTAGGKHALHEDDVTVGAAFMLGTDKGAEVHAHVKSVDGDKVTVEYDDGPRKGEKETMSKRDLLSKLDAAHGISAALQSEREKQAKVVSELRASGASEKQVAREQARLDRLGVKAKEPEVESPAPKKRGTKKPEKTAARLQLEADIDAVFSKESSLLKYSREVGYLTTEHGAERLLAAEDLKKEKAQVPYGRGNIDVTIYPEFDTEHYRFFNQTQTGKDKYGWMGVLVVKGPNAGKVVELTARRMHPAALLSLIKDDPEFKKLFDQLDENADSLFAVRKYIRDMENRRGRGIYLADAKNLDRKLIRELAASLKAIDEAPEKYTSPTQVDLGFALIKTDVDLPPVKSAVKLYSVEGLPADYAVVVRNDGDASVTLVKEGHPQQGQSVVVFPASMLNEPSLRTALAAFPPIDKGFPALKQKVMDLQKLVSSGAEFEPHKLVYDATR
jgi:hypothetical protein